MEKVRTSWIWYQLLVSKKATLAQSDVCGLGTEAFLCPEGRRWPGGRGEGEGGDPFSAGAAGCLEGDVCRWSHDLMSPSGRLAQLLSWLDGSHCLCFFYLDEKQKQIMLMQFPALLCRMCLSVSYRDSCFDSFPWGNRRK